MPLPGLPAAVTIRLGVVMVLPPPLPCRRPPPRSRVMPTGEDSGPLSSSRPAVLFLSAIAPAAVAEMKLKLLPVWLTEMAPPELSASELAVRVAPAFCAMLLPALV